MKTIVDVPGQEPSPNGTPVVQDGKVYATGPQAHNLYCLEAASGNLVWERDLAQDYQIEETATLSASPLVDLDRVILQVGGKPDVLRRITLAGLSGSVGIAL